MSVQATIVSDNKIEPSTLDTTISKMAEPLVILRITKGPFYGSLSCTIRIAELKQNVKSLANS